MIKLGIGVGFFHEEDSSKPQR